MANPASIIQEIDDEIQDLKAAIRALVKTLREAGVIDGYDEEQILDTLN